MGFIAVFSDDDCPKNNKQREPSLSISSRTSGQVTTKNYNDFGPSERYSINHALKIKVFFKLINEINK